MTFKELKKAFVDEVAVNDEDLQKYAFDFLKKGLQKWMEFNGGRAILSVSIC